MTENVVSMEAGRQRLQERQDAKERFKRRRIALGLSNAPRGTPIDLSDGLEGRLEDRVACERDHASSRVPHNGFGWTGSRCTKCGFMFFEKWESELPAWPGGIDDLEMGK